MMAGWWFLPHTRSAVYFVGWASCLSLPVPTLMLREIDKNLWVSEQKFQFLGLEVGTRMTVIRLSNGELIAISPIDIIAD